METFMPSWSHTWTVKEAEYELAPFVFKGEGWYISMPIAATNFPGKTNIRDTLLVVASDDNPEKFIFHIYNGRNPTDIFNAIVNLPTRTDER